MLQRLQALITMAPLVLTIRTMNVLQRLQARLTAYTAAACTINACTLHGAHVHVHVHGESTACAWRVLHGSTLANQALLDANPSPNPNPNPNPNQALLDAGRIDNYEAAALLREVSPPEL